MCKGEPLTDFVLDWEKALGYKADPFADRIMEPASRFLVNRMDEKEKVNWFFIKGYFFGSIIGEHGVGKTTFLKWLIERLQRYDRIHCVYINAAVFREQINLIHQIAHPLLTFYEKNWTKPHQKVMNFDHISFLKKKLGNKSIALLIDNAHNLTDRNMELIKTMREEGLRVQVIVSTTQNDFEKSRLPEFGNDELNLTLRRLTFEESKEMLRKRIEVCGGRGFEPFTDDELRVLFEKADKNPRQFIHLCRDEAIKILLQKRDKSRLIQQDLEMHAMNKMQKKKMIEFKKGPIHEEPVPAAPQVQPEPVADAKWKAPLKFKFDIGKKPEGPRQVAAFKPAVPSKFRNIPANKKIVGNAKYSSDLLDQLSSPRQKKKQTGSDADSLLRDD
jgi:type II secretory pathway predicted ATPase ExeA